MLVWTESLRSLQILEIFYGTYMATEIGYFTYIYAKVDKEHYLKVTSYARAAVLSGRFVAGTLGQTLVYTNAMDYRQLHILTLAAQIGATIWSLLLPSVGTSLYFHKRVPDETDAMIAADCPHIDTVASIDDDRHRLCGQDKFAAAVRQFGLHFKSSYTNYNVIIWSVWYAVAMCGYLQIISYIQVLWTNVENKHEVNGHRLCDLRCNKIPKTHFGLLQVIWNGAVEACITLVGAAVAILAGCIHMEKIGEKKKLFALLVLSILQGLAILLASGTTIIYISYLGYMLFCILYSFTITVARYVPILITTYDYIFIWQ